MQHHTKKEIKFIIEALSVVTLIVLIVMISLSTYFSYRKSETIEKFINTYYQEKMQNQELNLSIPNNKITCSSNQSNFNATVTNNVNPGQGEKYEKIVDGVSISFIKLNEWKYEELPATEEYKFALKFYKNSNDKYATLYFYNTMSAVCGTDRRVDTLNLNNGNKLNVGYSTADNIWRDIYFSLNGKEIVMLNHTLDKAEADECLELVKTFDISKKGNVNDELTLSLKEGSLSDNGAVFVLKNNSVSVYTYDVEYDVEVKTDNGWKKIEDSRNKVWTKELYTIDPNKTNNIAIDFSEFKDKMVSNKVYRIVKRFVQNGDTNKEITVSAEFQMR